jgi:RNA polymerase sigma factor (sigma-70 family)
MTVLAGGDLVSAAQAGDQDALTALIAEYLPVTYNIVGRALNGHADVDDVVQETMIRVVRGLPDLQDPEKFRAWLASIAIRQVQERGRSQANVVRTVPIDEAPNAADPDTDFVDTTITRLSLTGERRDLVEASRWLNDEERRLLALWWQELAGSLSRAELADALAISPQHAAVRVQRLRNHLGLAWTLTRAWHASPRCPQLTADARTWTGTIEARWLKRLGRHIRSCDRCARFGRRQSVDHTLIGIGLVPLPVAFAPHLPTIVGSGLHPAVLNTALQVPGLFRRLAHFFTGKSTIVLSAALVSTSALTYTVYYEPFGPDRKPAAAAPETVSPTRIPSTVEAALPAASPREKVPGASSAPSASARAAVVSGVSRADVFVAPDGDDNGTGSLRRPYASLAQAVSVIRPGQTIAVRGGLYRPAEPVLIKTNGTAEKRITVSNYRNEKPVIDLDRVPADQWYITHRANYWTIQGLEIKNSQGHPYVCLSCHFNIFRRLSMHDNQGTALLLRDVGTIGNKVLDSDFFSNHDDDNTTANADGLNVQAGPGAMNLIRRCRAWNNADDGIDLGGSSAPATIDRSWSYGNGVNRWKIAVLKSDGNGFALAGSANGHGVDHIVTNSAAWDNTGYGFTEAGNRGALVITGNTAYRNRADGFGFYYSGSVLRRNLALDNTRQAVLGGEVSSQANSWDQAGWSRAALRGTDPVTATGERQPDGSLPPTAFLTNDRDPGIGSPMS